MGAKKCLAEKGYAHTTARDIVAASGANLAAIGYHFGSKDALLNAAVMESFDEWGDLVEAAMADMGGASPVDRLERFLRGLLEGAPERRDAIVASVQAFAQAEFAPEIRAQLEGTYTGARREIAAVILNLGRDEIRDEDLGVGTLALALINGVMLQWLVAPQIVPSASELAAALRALAPGAASDRS